MSSWLSSLLEQSWLVLLLAGVLGASLAAVDRSLQPRIQRNAQERLEKAILEVVPKGTASKLIKLDDGRVVYKVTDGGSVVGWAVPSETLGFQDKIKLLVGLSPDGSKITGIQVISSLETPGLGDKIKTETFRKQFIGKSAEEPVNVVKAGESASNSIDAITGATISSRAVTKAVNAATSWASKEVKKLAGGARK